MRFVILCCLLFCSLPANAREIAGVDVPESLQVENGPLLHLNGAGIRSKMFFDIYIAGLYLEQPSKTVEELIGAPGRKRMVMNFLYKEVGKDMLIQGWNEGFAANTDADQVAVLRDRIGQFNGLFVDMKKGQSIVLDFVPDQGTVMTIAGQPKGVIPGKDFNDALLRIWLGDKPVDKELKEKLLGSTK